MHKWMVLSASVILAAIASPAAAASHAPLRNIKVVVTPTPASVAGTVRVVFFSPDSATLTPMAQRIVLSAVHQAEKGTRLSLAVAEAAGTKPAAATALIWHARAVAVRKAIVRSDRGESR